MKKLLVFIFSLFILVGCTKGKELPPVTNIRVEDNYLKWNEVLNAEEYVVQIGDKEYKVTTNSLELINLDTGEYLVTIYSKAKGLKDSLKVSYKLIYERPIINGVDNLRIENKTLKWDEVKNETYLVWINQTEYPVENNEYDLSNLEVNKFYSIKVKALHGNYSNTIIFDTFALLDKEFTLIFNKSNPLDQELSLEEISDGILKIICDNNELNQDDYFIQDGNLVIKSTYLENVKYGNNELFVFTEEGKFKVIVEITDNRKPYLISAYTVEFAGNDVVFEFEIYDGEIVKISINDITDDDYEINGNKLIIKKEYISNTFSENLDRNSLIIMYHLKANTNYVLGSVQIKRSS